MSRRPIALSPDLLRLRNEGYDLDIVGGHLVVRDVPYVTSTRSVERGSLVVKLELAGDIATKPTNHVAYWIGSHPCHADGRRISAFENPSPPQDLGDGLRADHVFSAKANYRDYHHQVTTYVGRIAGEASKIDQNATPMTFPTVPEDDEESVFRYCDTASSRAGIAAINDRLRGMRVAIAGLGGTGAYVLDLVAKTIVSEIHIFDGDVFSQHNAFRSPGAASIEQLQARPSKVAHLGSMYGVMRKGIVVHEAFVEESNVTQFDDMDFVFICMDDGHEKRRLTKRLVACDVPFVDVGMGVLVQDDQLGGIVRVTTSAAGCRAEAALMISYADGSDAGNEYSSNIQIAELNAFNASLAVIRWKRLFGIYPDVRGEYYAGYSLRTGELVIEGNDGED